MEQNSKWIAASLTLSIREKICSAQTRNLLKESLSQCVNPELRAHGLQIIKRAAAAINHALQQQGEAVPDNIASFHSRYIVGLHRNNPDLASAMLDSCVKDPYVLARLFDRLRLDVYVASKESVTDKASVMGSIFGELDIIFVRTAEKLDDGQTKESASELSALQKFISILLNSLLEFLIDCAHECLVSDLDLKPEADNLARCICVCSIGVEASIIHLIRQNRVQIVSDAFQTVLDRTAEFSEEQRIRLRQNLVHMRSVDKTMNPMSYEDTLTKSRLNRILDAVIYVLDFQIRTRLEENFKTPYINWNTTDMNDRFWTLDAFGTYTSRLLDTQRVVREMF